MKTRKEFKKVRHIIRVCESHQWPGYPYCHFGVVDFKTKDCWDSNGRKNFVTDENWYKFSSQFEAGMLYHILDSDFDRKGNFIVDSHMENYRTFLDSEWSDKVTNLFGEKVNNDHFYIDNRELTRLFFAVYAAIREYKDTNKIMLYMYDGDAEYVDVKIFETLEDIQNYYEMYIKEN